MDTRNFFRSLLAFSIFPGIPLLILALSASMFLTLGIIHDTDPKAFDDYIKNALGLSGGTWYSLPAEAEEKIIALGFDPAVVADEIMANKWINKNGGEIDLGMQLAIIEGESKGGTNLGSCSGIASAAKYSHQEVVSAKWLLNYWKEHNVRDWSDIAKEMIRQDYSDYTGHCSAGEIGPNGILPSTGVKICRDGLSLHPDDLVKSCNFFDKRVAPYGKNWWLKAIGYKSGQTKDEKFDSLWGWNRSIDYRNQLVSRAETFNLSASDWEYTPTPENTYVFKGGWWRSQAIKVLKATGLFEGEVFAAGPDFPSWEQPSIVGSFSDPYPGSFLCGYGYGLPAANGIHWGIDLCIGEPWGSAPIYAMHSGIVKFSRYLSPSEVLAGQWWISGNVVAIEGKDEGGNSIWTAYGHGLNGSTKVKEGDIVEKGQLLMMSGSTGFSTGIHLHLAMKINGGWVNPTGYLGGD